MVYLAFCHAADGCWDLAREFGAHLVVDFSKEDPVARILAETGGIGVDTAIEALGADKSFQQCVEVTKPGGTISNVGYHASGDSVAIPRVAWGAEWPTRRSAPAFVQEEASAWNDF